MDLAQATEAGGKPLLDGWLDRALRNDAAVPEAIAPESAPNRQLRRALAREERRLGPDASASASRGAMS